MEKTFRVNEESYKPQYDDPIIKKLENLINSSCILLDGKQEVLTDYFSTKFIALIKKRFGILIKVVFNNKNSLNCSVLSIPLSLNNNDELIKSKINKTIELINSNKLDNINSNLSLGELSKRVNIINRNTYTNKDIEESLNSLILDIVVSNTKKLLNDNKNASNVILDMNKLYIKNYPISSTTIIIINRKFLEQDTIITTREKIAIILHELGHIFYNIISANKVVNNSNLFLDELSILTKSGNINIDIVMDKYGDYINNLTKTNMVNSSKYHMLDTETFADMLPTRFGLSIELISALNKVSNYDLKIPNEELVAISNTSNLLDSSNIIITSISNSSFFSFVFNNIFNWVKRFFNKTKSYLSSLLDNLDVPISPIIEDKNRTINNGILYNSTLNKGTIGEYVNLTNSGLKYDTPVRRIERISFDLTKILREYGDVLSKEEKTTIINQIDIINNTIDKIRKVKIYANLKKNDPRKNLSESKIYNIVTATGTDKELIKLMNNQGHQSYEKMKLLLNKKD